MTKKEVEESAQPTIEPSETTDDLALSPENPLADRVRQVLHSRHSFITWKGKFETQFGHPFGSFLSAFFGRASQKGFKEAAGFEWQFGLNQLCPAMKWNRSSDYVVISSLNDNLYERACTHPHAPRAPHAPHTCMRTQWAFLVVCHESHRSLENRVSVWRSRCPFKGCLRSGGRGREEGINF